MILQIEKMSKEEAKQRILNILRMALMVIWTVVLIAMLYYVIGYKEIMLANPCELCQNLTGKFCSHIGGIG